MRMYRMVLMLRSGLKKEGKEKLLDSVKKWTGAEDLKVTQIGEKKLTYPIKKERLADYVLCEFSADKVGDVDKRLLMQEDILRHLLVRTD